MKNDRIVRKIAQSIKERRHGKVCEIGNLQSGFVLAEALPYNVLDVSVKLAHAAYDDHMASARFSVISGSATPQAPVK